jgi:hypothetical protein
VRSTTIDEESPASRASVRSTAGAAHASGAALDGAADVEASVSHSDKVTSCSAAAASDTTGSWSALVTVAERPAEEVSLCEEAAAGESADADERADADKGAALCDEMVT